MKYLNSFLYFCKQIVKAYEFENFNRINYLKMDYQNFKAYLKTPSYPSPMDYSLIASLICIKVPTILFDDVYSVMFYFFKKEWIYMLVHSYYINRAF
ncbi:hypothetical protein ACTQ1R_13110 [Prevotellaceae bacterium LCP21S3_C11]